MIARNIAVPLHRAVQAQHPVLLEGPRGSGKTALLKTEFPRRLYITLEDAPHRRAARLDPARFLARLRTAAIIDDVHRAPELTAYLAQTSEPRSILLASSRKLTLPITTLTLYHPTRAELERRPPLPVNMLGHFAPVPLHTKPELFPWPRNATLLERDIQDLVRLRDLDRFYTLLEHAANTTGQVLDAQKLARLAGTSRTTAVRWLAVLDACFITVRVEPYDDAFGRRLIRSPKLHFLDTESFESRVVSEIYRNAMHAAQTPGLRYWRDSNGSEISLVVKQPGAPAMPVLIAEHPDPTHEARLKRWMNLAGVRNAAIISAHARTAARGGILRYTLDQL